MPDRTSRSRVQIRQRRLFADAGLDAGRYAGVWECATVRRREPRYAGDYRVLGTGEAHWHAI
jgi:hypothetical protein